MPAKELVADQGDILKGLEQVDTIVIASLESSKDVGRVVGCGEEASD